MKRIIPGFTVAALLSVAVAAQPPAPAIVTTNIPDVDRHVAAAKAAAGAEWGTLYANICGDAVGFAQPPAARGGAGARGGARGAGRGGGGGGRRGGGAGAPAGPPRETWYAEPVKVFDNLYFVGMTDYSAWAITTSDGIILLDAIFDYAIEAEVTEGLKKLGLDPRQIKYVIVSHGHLDHAGGAKYLQETYGARVVMGEADWNLLDQQNPSWKPKRDIVATDGMKLTLGDTTVTLYVTPGHTLGTLSTLIPVRDGTRQHMAAAWGGTRLLFGRNVEQAETYAKQAARFGELAAAAKADVLLSNHTDYDGSKTKLPAVLARTPGAPNPFVIGTDAVRRYMTVASECAEAAVAALRASSK